VVHPVTAAPSGDLASEPAEKMRAPNFDRLARIYRWMEYTTFGPWLGRCRRAFLSELGTHRRALVLGDGDGRFSASLLTANAAVEVDAVDASASMLRSLLRRAGHNRRRVRTEWADARNWQPTGGAYDLIVTHFFLDCLTTEEAQRLAEKLRSSASPDAVWIVSEFAAPEGWFGRLVARAIIGGLYAAFGLLTGLRVRSLPDHSAALGASGFVLERRRVWLSGLLVSELWSRDPEAGAERV
jgi:SAM-dependent methyltransferase